MHHVRESDGSGHQSTSDNSSPGPSASISEAVAESPADSSGSIDSLNQVHERLDCPKDGFSESKSVLSVS